MNQGIIYWVLNDQAIYRGHSKETNWNYVEVIPLKLYYILEGLLEYFEEMVANI